MTGKFAKDLKRDDLIEVKDGPQHPRYRVNSVVPSVYRCAVLVFASSTVTGEGDIITFFEHSWVTVVAESEVAA